MGRKSTKQVSVTARRDVRLTRIRTSAPFALGRVTLPRTVKKGQTVTVGVTFGPRTAAAASESLAFVTTTGTFAFDLHGQGTKDGLLSDRPRSTTAPSRSAAT